MKLFGFNITREPVKKLLNIPSARGWWFKATGLSENYEITNDFAGFEKAYREQVWVQRCINLIASSIASVPLKLYRYTKDGKEEITDHPILTLLDDVNPLTMNASDLWKATVIALKVYGNAYWYLERKGKGEPKEIYWLNPKGIEIGGSKKQGEFIDHYDYTTGNSGTPKIRYSPPDIIHFKYFNPSNDYYGLSPLSSIREAVAADLYAQAWNKYFFKNATRLDGFFTVSSNLNTEQRKDLKEGIEAKFKGVQKAHQIAVFEESVKYQPISTTPKDAEWGELRRVSREAICSALGVPPVLVVAYEAATYATAMEQKKSLWHETIIPELRYYEEVLNWNLVTQFANSEDLSLEYDLSNVEALREETSATYDRLYRATGVPFLTINEARELLGKESIENGDKLYIPLSMVTTEEQ